MNFTDYKLVPFIVEILDPSHVTMGIFLIYISYLLYLMLNNDKDFKRVGRLKVNGIIINDSRIVCATSWINKRVGLLNVANLSSGSGLFIDGARKVHTVGMLFALDIIFLSAQGKVLKIGWNMQPGRRAIKGPRTTKGVLELAAGEAIRLKVVPGSIVVLEKFSES